LNASREPGANNPGTVGAKLYANISFVLPFCELIVCVEISVTVSDVLFERLYRSLPKNPRFWYQVFRFTQQASALPAKPM